MKYRAFTLVEMLVTLAIMMIMVAALAGGGKYLQGKARQELTRSTIAVVRTALEQYYEQYQAFPTKLYNRDNNTDGIPDAYTKDDFQTDTGGTLTAASGEMLEVDGAKKNISNASSAALYYYLDRGRTSRAILRSLSEKMLTNKDAISGAVVQMTLGGVTYDLPRIVDAWGMSLRYEYMNGYTFGKITSAGADRIFGTEDDLKSQ